MRWPCPVKSSQTPATPWSLLNLRWAAKWNTVSQVPPPMDHMALVTSRFCCYAYGVPCGSYKRASWVSWTMAPESLSRQAPDSSCCLLSLWEQHPRPPLSVMLTPSSREGLLEQSYPLVSRGVCPGRPCRAIPFGHYLIHPPKWTCPSFGYP